MLNKIYEGIEGKRTLSLLKIFLSITQELRRLTNTVFLFWNMKGLKLDVSNWLVYLRGEIDPIIFIRKLYKARSYVELFRIDYGYEENPQGTRKPNSHFMVLYISQQFFPFHYFQYLSMVWKFKFVCVLAYAEMLLRTKHIRYKLV